MSRLFKNVCLVLLFLTVSATSVYSQFNQRPSTDAPKHEFRSIWVATALGLDWPKTTDVNAQKQALRDIIRRHHEMRMNAVVFQVTARGDSHYQSDRLPWAIRLTGTMGQDPGWDPLQFVIDESKLYGLEVHAWYNVFNIGNTSELNAYAVAENPQHVAHSNPEWVQTFDGGIWLNPGIPAARQWAIDNVMEIVENYDVDAIHFDFARYPSQNGFTGDVQNRQTYTPDFPGTSDMASWRRHNVNEFQRDVYAAVMEVKPWVKVGTTPVGHYQTSSWPQPWSENCPYFGTSTSCSWPAMLAYSQVYQDAVAWINEGVNDYIAPQLYWSIGAPSAHFEYLARDWRRLTEQSGKHVYIGIGPYVESVIPQVAIQVDTVRVNNHAGHLFFRYDNVYGPGGASTNFRPASRIDYGYRALVPSMDWKDSDVPPAVQIERVVPLASIADDGNDLTLNWDAPDFVTASGDTKLSYAIYRVASDIYPDIETAMADPANLYALTGETSFTDRITEAGNYFYFVTAYSRNWVEGAPSNVYEHYTATSIDETDQIAAGFKLEQNYPNPFNPSTQIRFTLGQPTHATLTVYDIMGRVVATLVDQSMPAGSHSAVFNAANLSSGVYIYTLQAGDFVQTNKMLLVK